jgi:hypothetical protein
MLDNFVHWFRYSTLLEKAIVLAIMFLGLILIVGVVDPGDTQANRKTFCLDRGYDKYEVSQENFYCKNDASGAIKKFPDPMKKKVKAEKRSWE